MSAEPRHKYVVVLGSCCTADALRPKDFDDLRDANLRLLWYQGRTSPLSMRTRGLEPHEFTCRDGQEDQKRVDWGLTMALDETKKRQHDRLRGVIGMGDALILDIVSWFAFPYLVVNPGERYFLQSKEWERHIDLLAGFERKWLWEVPLELSLASLRETLTALYERQPSLRVIFHLPRPCFNDGVSFEDPQVAANVGFYHQYGERLYDEAARSFPRVSIVACGGERADPLHPNGAFPFHFEESYMSALRNEIRRLLDVPDEGPGAPASGAL